MDQQGLLEVRCFPLAMGTEWQLRETEGDMEDV